MAETALARFRERVAAHPDRTALRALRAGGAPADLALSWREWHDAARRMAAALVAAGHRPGDRVAVLAGNRPLWPIADLGVLMAGGVSVGIYPTSAPAQVRQILADSGAVAVLVDAPEQLAKVQAVRAALPALRAVVCEDAVELPEGVQLWDRWLALGERLLADEPRAARELDERAAALGADDDALLIYTSGSTGEPKGARITHRTLLASARSIRDALGLQQSDRALSFLPFCHAAERVFGLYTRIECGMEAGLVQDHLRLWQAARAFGPTLFGGLPRFFEKVYEALEAERLAAPAEERARWDRVLALGAERSRLRQAGRAVPPALEQEWHQLGEPLFARVRAFFGGRIRLATSGGAALPEAVAERLDALGLTVLGAYGLTEHLCAAMNRPARYALDAAGPPMPGAEMRFADDGEILLRRGPLTFAGYHDRPRESRDAFTPDGEWLRTGDLGTLDARGMLRVTGRKKELIALSTGKKVAPLPIEQRLARSPWIAQAVLLGEGRKFVSALLVPSEPAVRAWAAERGLALSWPELLALPALRTEVQAAVDRVNAELSRTERVRAWLLLDRELSAESGELTPTLKVRRAVVAERFGDRIDPLYTTPAPDTQR